MTVKSCLNHAQPHMVHSGVCRPCTQMWKCQNWPVRAEKIGIKEEFHPTECRNHHPVFVCALKCEFKHGADSFVCSLMVAITSCANAQLAYKSKQTRIVKGCWNNVALSHLISTFSSYLPGRELQTVKERSRQIEMDCGWGWIWDGGWGGGWFFYWLGRVVVLVWKAYPNIAKTTEEPQNRQPASHRTACWDRIPNEADSDISQPSPLQLSWGIYMMNHEEGFFLTLCFSLCFFACFFLSPLILYVVLNELLCASSPLSLHSFNFLSSSSS